MSAYFYLASDEDLFYYALVFPTHEKPGSDT